DDWQKVLAEDYLRPTYHIGLLAAVGRRIRSNYLWILLIQTLAYAGKLAVHPTPVADWTQAVTRADVGPLPGEVMIFGGMLYVALWVGVALWSWRHDRARAAH